MLEELSNDLVDEASKDFLRLRLKAHRVVAALREAYGRGRPRYHRHPTDCLIATILSQHTADRNSSAAYRALKERYPSWQDVLQADTAELASTIRVAGLANIKAQRIQDALHALVTRHGTLDLDFLRGLPMEEAREVLLGLPGIGPKTAACVLLFSCGHPALPVDTHVHRLGQRLGLIGWKDSAERAHSALARLVPEADVYDFHVNLIAHGRQVCHARTPSCAGCILRPDCVYVRQGDAEWRGDEWRQAAVAGAARSSTSRTTVARRTTMPGTRRTAGSCS
jgi:endonuclease-3